MGVLVLKAIRSQTTYCVLTYLISSFQHNSNSSPPTPTPATPNEPLTQIRVENSYIIDKRRHI